jgi:hypothetical protein
MSVDCVVFHEILQSRLDGEREPLSVEFHSHRLACPECAADYRAAAILVNGLRSTNAATLSNEKIEHIVQVVLSDNADLARSSRRILRHVAMALAAAACLALAFVIGSQLRPKPVMEQINPVGPIVADNEKPISIDESLADAGSTLAELSRKNRPLLEPKKWLSTDAKSPAEWLNQPVPDPIQPAAQSLADIRQGAEAGFEPMAKTAKRAFAFFTHDLTAQSN